MLIAFIWLALVLAALAYAIIVYNGLVNLKHAIGKAWSNIDVLLKQRHDELPKLVETCKQYMQFERSALEKIMAARTGSQQAREAGDVKAVGRAESVLRGGLGPVVATVAAYPAFKAHQSIQQLPGRIPRLTN